MKKKLRILSLAITLLALISLVSCSNKLAVDAKDKNWAFVMVSNDRTGDVEYSSAEFKLIYPEANKADLSVKFADGKLTLIDREMQMPYPGTYKLEKKSSDGAFYTFTIQADGEVFSGKASVTEAKLHDDSVEYTLILTVDGYNIYFKSVK